MHPRIVCWPLLTTHLFMPKSLTVKRVEYFCPPEVSGETQIERLGGFDLVDLVVGQLHTKCLDIPSQVLGLADANDRKDVRCFMQMYARAIPVIDVSFLFASSSSSRATRRCCSLCGPILRPSRLAALNSSALLNWPRPSTPHAQRPIP